MVFLRKVLFIVWWSLLLCIECYKGSFEMLNKNLKSCSTPLKVQETEVRNVIARILPQRASEFRVQVIDRTDLSIPDFVQVDHDGSGTVDIRGSSPIAVAFGFHHFLKYFCHSQMTFSHKNVHLPRRLPKANLRLEFQDLVRYYQNVCEYGYSFAWWDWQHWQHHIDWMALNGRNLVLAQSGQEFIFLKTLASIGMTQKQILTYFTGPAFLPWNRMGNLRGWGGPLPYSYVQKDRILQHKILQRLRNLCLMPVTPAFNGIVPNEVIDLYPNITFSALRPWGHFGDLYSSSKLVDMSSSLGKLMASRYFQFYQQEYGISDFYSLDTFNEMSPPNASHRYLESYANATFSVMNQFNSHSIWLLQGWLFRNHTYWSKDHVKSFITTIPKGRVLILDEASNTSPEYERLESYFGQPFVFCLLQNYGATMGYYGKIQTLLRRPYEARKNFHTMVGTGLSPEGLQDDYIMYDILIETSVRERPIVHIDQFIADFARRRSYPASKEAVPMIEEAWILLANSVFNCTTNLRYHGKSMVTEIPSLRMKTQLWYQERDLLLAWDKYLEVARGLDGNLTCDAIVVFDSIQISRQVLADSLVRIHQLIVLAYEQPDEKKFEHYSHVFLQILLDLDQLMGTCDEFLLGKWLKQVARTSTSRYERLLYEFNAKNQITLWGPEGNILDYASKQWNGLIKDYYYPRWKLFFHQLWRSMKSCKGKKFDPKVFRKKFITKIGLPFGLSVKSYKSRPVKNPLNLVKKLYKKWRNKIWE